MTAVKACINGQLKSHFTCCLMEILGYIHPHTECGCAFSVIDIAQNRIALDIIDNAVNPCIKRNLRHVKVDTERIVAVVNLSAILSCGEKCGRFAAFADLTAGFQRSKGIGHPICEQPCDRVICSHPITYVTIFKIEQYFRTLAEINDKCQLRSCRLVCSSNCSAADSFISRCSECHSIQSACCCIRQVIIKGIAVKVDLRLADSGYKAQSG